MKWNLRQLPTSTPEPNGNFVPPLPEKMPGPSAKRSGAVTIVGQIVKMSVQLTGLIAFSHLLTPRDVGLISMLAVFISLGDIIRDFGLSQAAVQTPKLAQGQATNLFWTNTLIGLTMTAGLAFAAPLIADMYDEPILRSIAPWIALTLMLNAAQAQFQVRLVRDFRFTALTMTDVASQAFGLIAGLLAASLGAGYWSLVIQMQCICGSLLLQRVLIARWWPGFPRREPGMAALYRFGLHAGLAQLLGYAASNADSYIVGIRWGASELGIYNRAYQIYTVVANNFIAPVSSVALSFLSKQRADGVDFYPLLWKAQLVISTFITFAFLLIGSLADPIVRLALGPAWAGSAPLISILAVGGSIQTFNYIVTWAFLASGNAKQLLFNGLVNKPLLILSVVIGSHWGLEGVAWGFSAGLAIAWATSLVWLKICDEMPVSKFLYAGSRVFLCGLIAGALVWTLTNYLEARVPTLGLLVVGFVASATIYVPLVMSNKDARGFLTGIFRPIFTHLKAGFRNDPR